MREFALAINPNEEIETPDIEELLIDEKVPSEITEIIKNHEYLKTAVLLTSEELNEHQLKHVLSTTNRINGLSLPDLSQEEKDLLRQAALIHDVGKALEKEISFLITNGKKFTPEDRKKTEKHVELMEKWAEENNVPLEVIAIAARHHEFKEKKMANEQGLNGYPRHNGERRTGGKKNNIDLERRKENDRRRPELNNEKIDRLGNILHITDEFDALRMTRSYKPPFSHNICREILKEKFTTKEDEEIIENLIKADLSQT